jgi:hypothetical protein
MSPAPIRAPVVSWLYCHNPFYAVSAVLMLYAVRNAYGELEIGTINCWIMMGVLAGYTSVLALIGVLIVRWGKVWEDARSILLLLIVLFLAVSVSADDLFADIESAFGGAALLAVGFVFSSVLSEVVLRFAAIRLGAAYRVPYHLLLLLFFAAPWWCSPGLHPRSPAELEWAIFLFPLTAAGLLLCLVPAVRRGPGFVTNNGTPWGWPWFPWAAFGVIIGAVALRTFALCMTFGPSGPIWVYLSGGGRAIAFDTMWGPYFLVPPAFSVLVLLLDGSLVTENRRLTRRILWGAPALLALCLPMSTGPVFREFLRHFTTSLGSPLWLAVWLLVGFYSWALCRKAAGAGIGVLAMTGLLSIVGPQSISFNTLTPPQPWPLLIVGGALLVWAWRDRSTAIGALSSLVLTAAVWLVVPSTPAAVFRVTICYHLLWLAVVVLGLAGRDRLAIWLRIVGALLMPLASVVVLASPRAAEVPLVGRLVYVAALAVTCFVIARVWRSRWYLYAFTSLLAIGGYGSAALGFRGAAGVLGRSAVTSFAWSVGALLLALLISAHKASWLPPRLFPRWANGHPPDVPPTDSPADTVSDNDGREIDDG